MSTLERQSLSEVKVDRGSEKKLKKNCQQIVEGFLNDVPECKL